MLEDQLTVGTFTRSLLIHLARESGRLQMAGLDVRESSVTSSPAQFRSLAAGELDLAITSPDNVLAYRFLSTNPLGGILPVEIVSAVDRGLGLSLCLAPSIKSTDHLRGQIVGVDVPQSGFAFVAFELLKRAGLQDGDYEIVTLGSTPRRATALINNECAATILNAGNELRARSSGCTIVSSVSDIGPYLGTVIAALQTQDPEKIAVQQRFADVLLETSREIVAGERDSEVVEAAISLLGLSEADAIAHKECLRDEANGLVPSGRVDAASILTLLELRRTHRPSSELEGVLDSLPEFIAERALE
jgi:ABC-type nitrate/sulfonate/bicarbonate transport system substrate-binding protein